MAPNLAWGGFNNGRIPLANLVAVQKGKWLQADAARNFAALASAFRARWGSSLYLAADQDAYRDIARQQFMLDHPELYPYAKAAVGTSVHGWARSVDITGYGTGSGTSRHLWLQRNAGTYGWSWAYGKALGEPWHWDYLGPITTTAGGGGSGGDDMSAQAEETIGKIWYVLTADGTGPAGDLGVEPRLRRLEQTIANIWYVLTADGTGPAGDVGVEPRLRQVQEAVGQISGGARDDATILAAIEKVPELSGQAARDAIVKPA